MKIISYNVDGLPERIDLKELPWGLRFISWIYKLIKKTTIVPINDGSDKETAFKNIDSYLTEQDADIILLQEYFNYPLKTIECLDKGTFTGSFDISKIPSNMTLFPPRFKADGLQLFTYTYKILKEDIVSWKKSYGYFTHANDKLTHKGFRYYRLQNEDSIIDVYNVHMDADFYHPENCPDVSKDVLARRSQLEQLAEYILNNSKDVPTIIMGDFNSYPKYEWDVNNINYFIMKTGCKEIVPENHKDCDRVFVLNIDNVKCYFDIDIRHSDHKPLVVEI